MNSIILNKIIKFNSEMIAPRKEYQPWINALIPMAMMTICAILLYMNRNEAFFFSDEGDNVWGGYLISKGIDVYSDDFVSQHMPIMYYICAIFAILGANNGLTYRLCFYTFLCLFWLAMYIRYNAYFGRFVCFLYPILYILSMRTVEFGYCILSEQLWAQGAVILLFEYFIYRKCKTISTGSIVWISIAVFISFGTCFMAIYSIAVIAIAFYITEFQIQYFSNTKITQAIKKIVQRTWKLISCIAAPFLILFIWYCSTGKIGNVIFDCFTFNTHYYSRYLNNIDSLSAPITTIAGGLINWAKRCDDNVVLFLFALIFIAFVLLLIINKKYNECVVSACLFLMCGVRGFFNFHALGQLAIVMIMLAIMFGYVISNIVVASKSIHRIVCVFVMMLILLLPLWSPYYKDRDELINDDVIPHKGTEYYVDILTDEGDYVWENSLNPLVYVYSKTFPAAYNFVVPWIYDAFKDQIDNDIEQRKPKVVVYNENTEIWGYQANEVAPNCIKYIYDNYTSIIGYNSAVWVRNDYYSEAMKRLSNPQRYISQNYQ